MIRATMAFLGCILVCCIPPRMPFYPPQKRAGDLTSSATVAGAGSSLAVLRFACLPDLGRKSVSPPQKRAGDLTSSATVASAGSNLAVLRFSCLPGLGGSGATWLRSVFLPPGFRQQTGCWLLRLTSGWLCSKAPSRKGGSWQPAGLTEGSCPVTPHTLHSCFTRRCFTRPY